MNFVLQTFCWGVLTNWSRCCHWELRQIWRGLEEEDRTSLESNRAFIWEIVRKAGWCSRWGRKVCLGYAEYKFYLSNAKSSQTLAHPKRPRLSHILMSRLGIERKCTVKMLCIVQMPAYYPFGHRTELKARLWDCSGGTGLSFPLISRNWMNYSKLSRKVS